MSGFTMNACTTISYFYRGREGGREGEKEGEGRLRFLFTFHEMEKKLHPRGSETSDPRIQLSKYRDGVHGSPRSHDLKNLKEINSK